ncbi:MAG TPA: hypothetical protein VE136_12790, partial [Anaerolineales bacterium]|nr:hypothetical protein [Anaerolineales bacterium]
MVRMHSEYSKWLRRAKWGWRVGPVVALLVGLVLTGCALFNPLQQPTQVPVEAHTQAAETLA